MRERVRRNAWPHGTALIKIQAKAKRKSGRKEGGRERRTDAGEISANFSYSVANVQRELAGGPHAGSSRPRSLPASERAHAPGILDLT